MFFVQSIRLFKFSKANLPRPHGRVPCFFSVSHKPKVSFSDERARGDTRRVRMVVLGKNVTTKRVYNLRHKREP